MHRFRRQSMTTRKPNLPKDISIYREPVNSRSKHETNKTIENINTSSYYGIGKEALDLCPQLASLPQIWHYCLSVNSSCHVSLLRRVNFSKYIWLIIQHSSYGVSFKFCIQFEVSFVSPSALKSKAQRFCCNRLQMSHKIYISLKINQYNPCVSQWRTLI